MNWKPENYPSLSPYLIVDDARAAIDFLVQVFDATRLRMVDRDDGSLAHGEVRIDDSVVMLGTAMDGWPALPSHIHLYVSDVDGVYRRAIAAGAAPLQEPVVKGDPDKRGGFRDAWGTTWWVAQQMA